jgi:sulfonate transport system permease protein
MRYAAQLGWWIGSFAAAAILIGCWQLIADVRLIPPIFLPGPDRAWSALVSGFGNGDLTAQFVSTIEHMIAGWLLASILGVTMGIVIGMSRAAQDYLEGSLEFLRPLPASAIAPLAISFLGLSPTMVVAVIGFGTLWPMLLATIHGFSATQPRLIEVSKMLRLSPWDIIWKIRLPNAMPDILASMRFAISVALILAVIAEMLASQDGLGQRILFAARAFRSADVYAGVILLGVIGFVSNVILSLLERWLLRWRLYG